MMETSNPLKIDVPIDFFDNIEDTDFKFDKLTKFDYEISKKAIVDASFKKSADQLDERNLLYTKLLKHYIDRYEKRLPINQRYKTIFFYFFMAFLFIISLSTTALIVFTCYSLLSNNIICSELIVGLITAGATMITSLLVIPKIIATYLFSTQEDQYMSEIVNSMLTQDDKTRSIINKDDITKE